MVAGRRGRRIGNAVLKKRASSNYRDRSSHNVAVVMCIHRSSLETVCQAPPYSLHVRECRSGWRLKSLITLYPLEDLPVTSMCLERDRQHACKSPSVTTARSGRDLATTSNGTSANRAPFKRAEFRSPMRMAISAVFLAAGIATATAVFAGTERESENMADTSDTALAASLPGHFRNGYAEVNRTRIHYVEDGKGTPVLLLPGWPQTWWEFHKIMPELAKHHRVIAVDLRGMGGSAKPESGYDKRNMAKDIHELARALGYKQVNIAGHDIGAMIAYSFAANFPDATLKICLIDVAHPEESLYTLSLLPPPGYAVRGTGESTHPVYLWWFAFNQLPDLPQQLLAGKFRLLIDWLFDSQLRNPAAISERDRAIYAAAYSQPDAIRAGNGWYQTFGQDIVDAKHYGQIATPVLALTGERNYPYLRELLPTQASDVRIVKINSSSHYVPEDQPEAVVRELLGFFKP